jgi:lysophospholipid acyltransferase (LPLAT)-like uncharacterized protein
MQVVKSLTRSEGARRLFCWLGSLYIRLVFVTGRWDVVGGEIPAELWDRGVPFILAFWHGRILMMPYCWRLGLPIRMLISSHRDGALISGTVKHFGIDTVAGSTRKGGSGALRAMLHALKSGIWVGITPDGPRGPRMRASEGVVQVARMSGAPVVACSFSAARRKVLGSWDGFLVAWPFSRGVFVWGEPVSVARDSSAVEQEQARLAIEASLNAVTSEADQRMGHAFFGPAEPAAS